MPYKIIWSDLAIGQLRKLDSFVSKRIIKKVREFSENPFSKDIKRLKGLDSFRLRVGDYRVVFDLNNKTGEIRVCMLGHRKNIYEKI